jgi:hypothetical protein
MLSSKKYTLRGLKSKSCDLSIDLKFYVELKIVYVMGFEMQPQIMRAQKSEEILIFEINKDY